MPLRSLALIIPLPVDNETLPLLVLLTWPGNTLTTMHTEAILAPTGRTNSVGIVNFRPQFIETVFNCANTHLLDG